MSGFLVVLARLFKSLFLTLVCVVSFSQPQNRLFSSTSTLYKIILRPLTEQSPEIVQAARPCPIRLTAFAPNIIPDPVTNPASSEGTRQWQCPLERQALTRGSSPDKPRTERQ
jgi:hypothetical protein